MLYLWKTVFVKKDCLYKLNYFKFRRKKQEKQTRFIFYISIFGLIKIFIANVYKLYYTL